VLINNPITACIWYIDTGYINVSKQAINETFINDKLQSRVATYLRCGGVNNNQIKKGLLLSLTVKEFFFEIGEYLAKLQAGTWLSRALFRLLAVWWPGGWPVKFFCWKPVKISQNYVREFVASLFWPILYISPARLSQTGSECGSRSDAVIYHSPVTLSGRQYFVTKWPSSRGDIDYLGLRLQATLMDIAIQRSPLGSWD